MEQVLAIPSHLVKFNGIINHNSSEGNQLKRILEMSMVTTRPECETDYDLKQLICYGFICYKDQVFIVKRLNKQSENRLHNLYSIGIGGHCNPEKLPISETLYVNMVRELDEEVSFTESNISLYGFINDDSNDVCKVHLGIVYKIDLISPEFFIKETDKMEGKFIPIDELPKYYNKMETWSQILCKYL